LGDHGHGCRSHKHAIAHGAVKVALALHAAIVFAGAVVELDADPVALGEAGLPDEADRAIAAVAQLDFLPNREL
jgi:hypothetical protein